ncbi:hypothetical protein [Streptomyces anulatus]|uniref:hypothetical protein n=1 Tax=Streptomyces anulatus TaxID=1892 RepID=UPI0037DD2AA1|nr:hypothetical protein OHB50_38995 [Streptomyces anulatus]
MPEESFTARNAALTEQIIRARRAGDRAAAAQGLEELLERYTRLGERRAGTDEEQNSYIVARRLGALPAELAELGVDASNLPPPPSRRAAAPPPPADVDESSIVSRFARIRADDQNDEQDPRFHVDYRPQDNMRYRGRLLPYAVVDQEDGLPVGWYPDNDWADWIADTASRMREAS